jgi:hypothetical protein
VIWDRQKYEPNALICEGDGPIAQFRKFYSRYYAEPDQAPDSGNVTPLKKAG